MGLEACRDPSGGSCLQTSCHGVPVTQLVPKKVKGLLVGAGGLPLSQPPPCLSLPPGCEASCLLFTGAQGCLQPWVTQAWSCGGS